MMNFGDKRKEKDRTSGRKYGARWLAVTASCAIVLAIGVQVVLAYFTDKV